MQLDWSEERTHRDPLLGWLTSRCTWPAAREEDTEAGARRRPKSLQNLPPCRHESVSQGWRA